MASERKILRKLQQHLDKQPVGFPRALFGADIRLLKHHFNREEAEVALKLTYRYESLETIHTRVKESGIAVPKLRDLLYALSEKGSIGYRKTGGVEHFCLVPLVVGMYEGRVFSLTEPYLKDVKRYQHSLRYGASLLGTGIPQMRTIPVERSIKIEQGLTGYDDIVRIINDTDGPIVVLECICRKADMMKGKPCEKTKRLETCMTFRDVAIALAAFKKGRRIDKKEALEIMRQNQQEGLVLQAFNSREPDAVCSCCGCCCGMLGLQKLLPKPIDFWASNFHAAVDNALCTGCGLCEKQCQVAAVQFNKKMKRININLKRCIGCGNCVPKCVPQAIRLVRKEMEAVPPKNYEEMQETIMKQKSKNYTAKVINRIVAGIAARQ
ncbi:MAG: hypothetical protein A2W19_09295 [Spirochaetes bacterium RBG_16_49_21]|nr:MAG: hypothetical protein A2W19_09295 [Spirochaetes bacterium RBG_16_49_21]